MTGDEKTVKVAKLEWYREVLALEPNSKLFLPLARLLAELGIEENNATYMNEAFQVLRRGLSIHPDFMEARLFLIELLNACGCRSQCGAEVARLASLFLSYPDFWDAWREYAILENESTDFTVALGFMSAIMRNKSLKIVDVLEAGLASLRSNNPSVFSMDNVVTSFQEDIQKTSQDFEDISKLNPDFSKVAQTMKNVLATKSSADDTSVVNDFAPLASEVALQNLGEEESVEIKEDTQEDEDLRSPQEMLESLDSEVLSEAQEEQELSQIPSGSDADTGAEESFASEENAESNIATDTTLEDSATSQDECVADEVQEESDSLHDLLPKSHVENYVSFAEQQADSQVKTKQALAELIKDANITVEPAEKSPFRTKSMADLLSEQGDYKGALEIYQELLAKGIGNSAELEERIQDLKSLFPELDQKIDKSKLLAIDDMVDTSFGLMAKETLSTQESAVKNLDLPVRDILVEQDMPEMEQASSVEPSFDEEKLEETELEDVTDLLPNDFEPEQAIEDISLEDLMDKVEAEAHEQILEEALAENLVDETASQNLEQNIEQDLELNLGIAEQVETAEDIAVESSDNQEILPEKSPQKENSNSDVADLLTKLAERLEIRAK